jgi:hypothetical protein
VAAAAAVVSAVSCRVCGAHACMQVVGEVGAAELYRMYVDQTLEHEACVEVTRHCRQPKVVVGGGGGQRRGKNGKKQRQHSKKRQRKQRGQEEGAVGAAGVHDESEPPPRQHGDGSSSTGFRTVKPAWFAELEELRAALRGVEVRED